MGQCCWGALRHAVNTKAASSSSGNSGGMQTNSIPFYRDWIILLSPLSMHTKVFSTKFIKTS